MHKYIYTFCISALLYICAVAHAGTAETFTIDRTASNVTFDTIGTNKNRTIECPVGSTAVSAAGFANDDSISESGVKLNLDGSFGRTVRISFLRNATESDIQTIAGGGTISPVTTKVKLRVECMVGINVKKYGAMGDGVTIDDAAFTHAIADTPVDGELYIPAGNYVINQEFTINKRMRIRGDGYSTQIFQSNFSANIFTVSARGVRIEDIFLGSASTTVDTALINLAQAHHADVRNVTMRGGYYGILIDGTLSSTFTNVRSDANLGSPAFFAASQTSTNNTWVRSRHNTGFSANANVFINPVLEGGTTCFHHTDFQGQGNLTIVGGTIEACAGIGMLVEGNGAPVNVIGTHFEGNDSAGDGIDIKTDTAFGVHLYGVLSTGKIALTNIGSDHTIASSKINKLDIASGIKRTLMSNTMHSNTAPGSQINDASGHTLYMLTGTIQSLLSPSTTTIGLRTVGPPVLTIGPDADLVVEGKAHITGGVTP